MNYCTIKFGRLMLCLSMSALLSHVSKAQNSGTWNSGSGNDVGIETMAPDAQLEIVSPIDQPGVSGGELPGNSAAWRTNAFVITRQWKIPPVEFAPGSGLNLKPLMWVRTNYSFTPFTAPSYNTHLFMDANGNFGLGTANPQTRFHLFNGQALIENGSIEVRNTNGFNYGYASLISCTNPLTKAFAVTDGTQDLFLIWGNGVVNTKKIYVEEMQVTASAIGISWPDYVFTKKYQLMPLGQLEKYINENQHLPEVPSACEVETNGINVGEFNKILLKKVEELTLYMIEMKKENEQLANEVAELKKLAKN